MNNADVIEELCRISVKCFWLIPAILGGIGTLLTLMGSSLPKLFVQLPEFRNRKTIKYVICDKILYKRRERSLINADFLCSFSNLDYLCKALKNRHFRGYGQPNLLPIYYFWGKSLDMPRTARASRPDGAAHR